MARHSRMKAWDDAWERTNHVTHIGAQGELGEDRERLQKLLGDLTRLALPVEAVYRIADAVDCAWKIGRSDR